MPRLLLLLRRQVLPSLNPVQAALLFLRREAVEMLQALLQALLLLRRKFPELWIAQQCFLLIRQRLIAVRPQPVPTVTLPSLWRTRYFACQGIRSLRRTRHFMRLSPCEARLVLGG
jgi:hypothetical protein